MQFEPTEKSIAQTYQLMVQLITPRPIAWVSTISLTGQTNLAPYSFFNGVGAHPPSLVFCPVNRPDGTWKDTLTNIVATRQFVVNVVSFDQAAAMNQSSVEYASEVSEFEAVGIAATPSIRVKPPRVAGSKAQFECELLQIIHLAEGPAAANLVIGKIVLIHVDDTCIANQQIMADKLDTIGRMGGMDYARTNEKFQLPRPTI